jgi:hypothetical protein
MKIEIRNLKIAASLSEETTATVYVDGVATFAASNHGTGGCDMYHRLPTATVTESDVNTWLADNCPPDGPYEADPAKRQPYDTGTTCNLETFVGRFVARAESEKETKRIRKAYDKKLATRICALRPDGAFVIFGKAVHVPTPANVATLSAKNPGYTFLSFADEATKEKGLRAFCPNLGATADATQEQLQEAVHERLREDRLTVADAKYLLAQERRAPKPTADFIASLEQTIATGEAAYAAYCKARDNERVQRAAYDGACRATGQVS